MVTELQAIAKRVETLTVKHPIMRDIEVSTPLPPCTAQCAVKGKKAVFRARAMMNKRSQIMICMGIVHQQTKRNKKVKNARSG